MEEILAITLRVTSVLERLKVLYLVGGSLASSLHGIPRATQGVDIVAVLDESHVDPLVQALKDLFYVDAPMIRSAIRHHSSFNLIYLPTMFKIDIFVPEQNESSRIELERRVAYALDEPPHQEIIVASAEDIIVQKLYWYKLGNEISDRQWQDVLGVLKVQGNRIDRVYLEQAASPLNVTPLLQRALDDANLSRSKNSIIEE